MTQKTHGFNFLKAEMFQNQGRKVCRGSTWYPVTPEHAEDMVQLAGGSDSESLPLREEWGLPSTLMGLFGAKEEHRPLEEARNQEWGQSSPL